MRTCFLHIGTFKTGTTSLQIALGTRYEELRRRGYLYPLSGRTKLPHGHHTIAEALFANRSQENNNEELDALLREITDSDCDVILSSELFHAAAHNSEKFGEFIDKLRSCGLDIVIVTYLRNQVDYARSLYLELLKHGLTNTFEEFLHILLEQGSFSWKGAIFAFCYTDFLNRLTRLKDVRLVVRSFDQVEHSSVLPDFFSIVGVDPAEVGVDASLRVNPTSPLIDSVVGYYENCTGMPAQPIAKQIVAAVLGALDATSVGMSMVSKRKIIEKFAGSNQYVFATYNIPEFKGMKLDELHLRDSPGGENEGIRLETVFSSRVRSCMQQLHAAIANTSMA